MRFAIKSDDDIITSRAAVKEMAREAGFGIVEQTMIATAVSELTRNIVKYAGEGLLYIRLLNEADRTGLEFVCEDRGPGIDDIEQTMQAGFSTGNGLGMGLSGARKLMDEFSIESESGKGVRVVARKWL